MSMDTSFALCEVDRKCSMCQGEGELLGGAHTHSNVKNASVRATTN